MEILQGPPHRVLDGQLRHLRHVQPQKAAQGISAIFEITLTPDGKFVTGKIVPAKQIGRGGPVPDETGTAIKKLRQLSVADFGTSAPKIADDGTIQLPLNLLKQAAFC